MAPPPSAVLVVPVGQEKRPGAPPAPPPVPGRTRPAALGAGQEAPPWGRRAVSPGPDRQKFLGVHVAVGEPKKPPTPGGPERMRPHAPAPEAGVDVVLPGVGPSPPAVRHIVPCGPPPARPPFPEEDRRVGPGHGVEGRASQAAPPGGLCVVTEHHPHPAHHHAPPAAPEHRPATPGPSADPPGRREAPEEVASERPPVPVGVAPPP